MGKKGKEAGKEHSGAGAKIDVFKVFQASPTKIPKVAKEAAIGAPPAVNWKLIRNLGLVIACVVLATHANSLFGSLVFSDKETLAFLQTTGSWESFWNDLWARAFTSPLTGQWVKATFAWDVQSAGSNLIWFHAVNVLLHLFSCLYLFALVLRVCWRLKNSGRLSVDPYHVAFAASLVFACHPLTTGSVAYLSGRAGPLLSANYLLALNCFLLGYLGRGPAAKFWGYVLAGLFLSIGLTVDAGALTLPVAMLSLALVLKEPQEPWLDWLNDHVWTLAALVLAAGTLPYLMLKGLPSEPGDGTGLLLLPPAGYFASQLKAVVTYYLRCFFVPVGLSVEPPWVLARAFVDPFALAGAAVLAACPVGMWLLRREPILSFALLIFLLGFLPASLIVQPEVVADRRFYLSLAGLAIIAGWLLARLAAASFIRGATIFGIVIVLLLGLSVYRNSEWSSNFTLFNSALRLNPDSARARAILSMELTRQGKLLEAARKAKEALRLDPRSAVAFLASGSVMFRQGDYQGAREAFEHAIQLTAEHRLGQALKATGQAGLAESNLMLKDYQKAYTAASEALVEEAGNARLHYICGRALLSMGQPRLAFMELKTAVDMSPGISEAYEPLAKAALKIGVPPVALRAAQINSLRHPSPEALILYARALILNKKHEAALAVLRKLVDKQAVKGEALVLLDVTEGQLGHKERADRYRDEALKVDPLIYSRVELPPREAEPVPGVNAPF